MKIATTRHLLEVMRRYNRIKGASLYFFEYNDTSNRIYFFLSTSLN